MNKKVFVYTAIAAVLGALLGSVLISSVSALSWPDWLKNLIPAVPATNTEPTSQTTNQPAAAAPYVSVIDYEQAIIKSVEKAEPGVVSIVISKDVPIIENCPYNPFGDLPPEVRQFFGDDFGFSRPCEKGTERREVGGGSGFVIDAGGLIVTNKHVVKDAKATYTVFTNDGKKYNAEVLARDEVLDFAVLKIKASGLTPLNLGDSDALKLGQTVIAIGNALGEFRNTVSAGVVSGLARHIVAGSGSGDTENIEGLIQTDAAINPGNSGGPLLNLKGEVVGINTAVASGAENIAFSIPINQVKRAIKSINEHGRILSPYLGIRYIMITESFATKEKLGLNKGAFLRGDKGNAAIVLGSPAAKAGLKDGDIILSVNGTEINESVSLGSLIQKYSVGESLTLKVLRGKDILEFRATLEERPKI